MASTNNCKDGQRGFTILQLLITVAVVTIVGAFALVKLSDARDYTRLQTSVRQLASYVEKARLDSIRRHASGSDMASVIFTSTSTYNVKMDFDGSGTVSTRSFSFEDGVSIVSMSLPSVVFNWRGRTSSCTITFTVQNSSGRQSWVDVSDAGDVTVDSDVDVLPTVSYSSVGTSSGISSGTVVTGTGTHNNTVDCGDTSGGSTTTAPPITGTGTAGCTMTANPSSLTVKKAGSTTGNVTLSVAGSGSYTITPSGPINLSISPTSRTLSGGSSTTFSIKSLNNSRGTFAVNFSSSCTTVTVAVKVTN